MGRRTMKIQLQYPDQSLNGRRLEALRKYFGDDLERNMIQAMWAVLGPLGSILAKLPEQDIQFHLNSSKLTIKGFRQEALDMIGGGEALPEGAEEPDTPDKPVKKAVTSEVTPEQPPSAPKESVSFSSTPEQSGDPLNNLF